MNEEDLTPLEHWEQRYSGSSAVWSGNVNATLAAALEPLAPGRSLDLGCGEGADVIWLAERGWDALGLDLSPTAIQRARAAADARGLDRARFAACDLIDWTPEADAVDLVTASFFHSRAPLARTEILRRALTAVASCGRMVVLSHAAPPPWSEGSHDHHAQMLSAEQEYEQLAVDPGEWTVETAEQHERAVTDPEGRPAVLEDSLLVLRRRN